MTSLSSSAAAARATFMPSSCRVRPAGGRKARLMTRAAASSPKLPSGQRLRVAVVGGGPAGGAAAEALAKGGVETMLIERKLDNCKPCGGAIPLCMVSEFDLPLDLVDRSQEGEEDEDDFAVQRRRRHRPHARAARVHRDGPARGARCLPPLPRRGVRRAGRQWPLPKSNLIKILSELQKD